MVPGWGGKAIAGLPFATQIPDFIHQGMCGWAAGIPSTLHATPSVASGDSAAIGHVALGKLPPLPWAQVSPRDPVESQDLIQLLTQQAWDGSEALSV